MPPFLFSVKRGNQVSEKVAAAAEATTTAMASKATMYTGGGASLLGFIGSVDWLAVSGFLIAIAGFVLNAYYQFKRNKREETESYLRMQREQDIHELEMKKRMGECDVK